MMAIEPSNTPEPPTPRRGFVVPVQRPGGYRRVACSRCSAGVWRQAEVESPLFVCGECAKSKEQPMCGICFEPRTAFAFPGQGCTHKFCFTCVGTFVAGRLEEGHMEVRCPHPGCNEPYTRKAISMLAKRGAISRADLDRFRELSVEGAREYLTYVLSGADPALTAWVKGNTQSCPSCLTLCQKSEGCNHMNCTVCSAEFCYACGAEYGKCERSCHWRRGDRPVLNERGLAPPPTPEPEPEPEPAPEPGAGAETAAAVVQAELGGRLFGGPPAATRAASWPGVGGEEAEGEGEGEGASAGRAAGETSALSAPLTAAEARALTSEILTLRCPNGRCGRAFVMDTDFSECFALRCASCPTSFCAWCLRPAREGEDPHTHVLDCPCAPADMRGHALYLQDANGGPHVPPNPHNKFSAHWRQAAARRIEEEVVARLPAAASTPELLEELRAAAA